MEIVISDRFFKEVACYFGVIGLYRRRSNITILDHTGEVSLTLDREALDKSGQIFVTLLATDGGNPPRTGLAYCTINVIDANDNIPYFYDNQKNVTLYIDEGKMDKDVFTSVVSNSD